MTPRDRYRSDPEFKRLVDSMLVHIYRADYTPGELRSAAILASIIHLETTIPRHTFPTALMKTLEEWENTKEPVG